MNLWGLESSSDNLHVNLARDEALLDLCESTSRASALRIWEQPTWAVVLGASGHIQEDVFVEQCERDAIAIGRRCSGGGTVVIGPGALNVTAVLPISQEPELSAVDTAQRYVLSR